MSRKPAVSFMSAVFYCVVAFTLGYLCWRRFGWLDAMTIIAAWIVVSATFHWTFCTGLLAAADRLAQGRVDSDRDRSNTHSDRL